MEPVVVATDVERQYDDVVALDGVSLEIGGGEVLALVGPNGAGKTTFVRATTGTTEVTGSIELFGADVAAVDEERIGVLPQEFDPPGRLTPRELCAYYAGLFDEARDVEAVLADVGVTDVADTWYEKLSGGQKRRTCVGTALVNDPDLLVLDEPTTGIDPAGRRTLWNLLEDLAASGTTILVTTHYMEEAEYLADRVGLLADGQLLALDAPDALVADHGGQSRLVIELADDEVSVDSLDAKLSAPATVADGHLTLTGVAPEDIGGIVATLDDEGVAYESLTWTEPDLEDVYLSLADASVSETGRSIEASPAVAPSAGGDR
jgi:ABC-2 type transport system ATP-binding protein